MKALLVIALCLTFYWQASAQYISIDTPQYKTIQKDTINIRGLVYDDAGRPVPNLRFYSKNNQLVYSGYPIYSHTDREGRFILNGALFNDTLSFYWNKPMQLVVNGSRYLEIHLPPLIAERAVADTVKVAAKRTTLRLPATFKVITNAKINDWYGVVGEGNIYLATSPRFAKYIQSKINYPQRAIENNIEGEVQIVFTVAQNGTLGKFKVIRRIGYGCEEEVINIMKNSPLWRPGIFNGYPLISTSSVTVMFKLTDK